MDVILGATGRVGSALVSLLRKKNRPVRAVVRNPNKAESLRAQGASIAVADFANPASVREALAGGSLLFIVTAEEPASQDGLAEATAFLHLLKDAVIAEKIGRIVGLSTMGAQIPSGTGFLEVSYKLEHLFDSVDIDKSFIRPSYYFSNWMVGVDVVKEAGALLTFFPADLAVPMIAPDDVASFAASVIADEHGRNTVYEITGPESLTPVDIGKTLGQELGHDVAVHSIPENDWISVFQKFGFSPANVRHMADMTGATVHRRITTDTEPVVLPTTFQKYVREYMESNPL